MCGRSCDVIGRTSTPTGTCDHMSISAALDDLRPQLTVTHSVYGCMRIDQHVDQSMFHCVFCLNVDQRLCFDCIDVCFESDRLPAKKHLATEKSVQLASETNGNILPSTCSSASKLLEDRESFFCHVLGSQRPWWRRDMFK